MIYIHVSHLYTHCSTKKMVTSFFTGENWSLGKVIPKAKGRPRILKLNEDYLLNCPISLAATYTLIDGCRGHSCPT